MKFHARTLFLIAASALFIACGPDAPQDSPPPAVDPPVHIQPVQGQGTIVGQVLFKGIPPVPKRVTVNKDKEACGEYQDNEELVVGLNKGIRWAVISLKSLPMEMRWDGITLDQQGCRFSPHIRLIPVGSKLTILNPDGVLHNFHSYSAVNPSVNKAQPKFKKAMEVSFDKPERFRIGCDAHGWMKGWIVVMEHPFYAVTDEKGSFKLEGVPAGKQVLKIWHETLGELNAEVEVMAGETTRVSFEMK